MKTLPVVVIVLSLLLGGTALAQRELVLTEKVLIPMHVGRFPGALGSDWEISLALTNLSGERITVGGPTGAICPPILCPYIPAEISPQATVNVPQMITSSQVPAAFFRTEPGKSHNLAITLRSQDLSRQGETWGSVVPVIREADLFSRRFALTDIPVQAQFRAMLRLYDVDPATPPQVRVRVYKVDPLQSVFNAPQESDELLLEFQPVFTIPSSESNKFWFPAYAQVALGLDDSLAGAERIRVEVEPLDGRADYWAFVSVTHNETQHVTIITP